MGGLLLSQAAFAPCLASSQGSSSSRSTRQQPARGILAAQQRLAFGSSGRSSSNNSACEARWRYRRPQQLEAAAAADADAAASLAAAAEQRTPQQDGVQQQPVAAAEEAAVAAAGGASEAVAAAAGAVAEAVATAADALPGGEQAPKKKSGSLGKRVVFGVILGLSGAAVIILGGWVYGAVAGLAAFQLSQEYLGLVGAKGIAKGSPPPPAIVRNFISLLCVALNAWVFITNGRAESALAVAAFMCLSLQLLAVRKPRFAQLTSSVFGIFYCGYLPSFWIKLRLMSIPAVNSAALAAAVPVALGGPTHLTVGLLAAFTTVACIIAADTGAYFTGKSFGRTQLSSVSPKKTVEGAVGGLLSSIGVALGLYKSLGWPHNSLDAAALGTIVFFASLFGDLIESVIKRDAGLKDASNLIPGHGGLLDRLDSYLFTGACVYFWTKFVLGSFGI